MNFDDSFKRTQRTVNTVMWLTLVLHVAMLAGLGWAGYELITWITSK